MKPKRIIFQGMQVSIAPAKDFISFDKNHMIFSKPIVTMNQQIPILTCFCSCDIHPDIHRENCPNYKES